MRRYCLPSALLLLFLLSLTPLHLRAKEATASSGESFTLVRDGMPACCIMIDKAGEHHEPVNELNDWIEKITGARLAVITPDQWDGKMPYIAVGPGTMATRNGWEVDQLKPEGAQIVIEKDRIGLLGRDSQAEIDWDKEHFGDPAWQGTYYSVLEFVKKGLGVRWIWPGALGEVYDQRSTLSVPVGQWTWETNLGLKRNLRGNKRGQNNEALKALGVAQSRLDTLAAEEEQWRKRMRLDNRRPSRYRSGHAFKGWYDAYASAHPDWFAKPPENGIQMKSHYVKLNLTNTELQEWIVENWRKAYERDPAAHQYLPMARSDGSGYCTRAESRAWDAPQLAALTDQQIWSAGRDVTLSDRYVRFWNIIGQRVAEIAPEARLTVYAYGAQQRPPLRETRLAPNVIMEYTGGEAHYPSEQPRMLKEWEAWRDIGTQAIIWRPNLFHAGRGMPYIFAKSLHQYLHFILANGCEGIDFSSITGNWAGQGLNYYMVAEMMARPGATYEEIADEYFNAFGAAAAPVKAYHHHWQKITSRVSAQAVRKKELSPGGGWGRWQSDFIRLHSALLTPEALDAAEEYLKEAVALADTETVKERLAVLRQALKINRLEARLFSSLKLSRSPVKNRQKLLVVEDDLLRPLWEARMEALDSPYLPISRTIPIEQRYLKIWDPFLARTKGSAAADTERRVVHFSHWDYRTSESKVWSPFPPAGATQQQIPGALHRILFPSVELGDHGGDVYLCSVDDPGEISVTLNGKAVSGFTLSPRGHFFVNVNAWLHSKADNELMIAPRKTSGQPSSRSAFYLEIDD